MSGIITSLEETITSLERVSEDESESLSNMPESIQSSERGGMMENAISVIDDAAEQISEVVSSLQDLI